MSAIATSMKRLMQSSLCIAAFAFATELWGQNPWQSTPAVPAPWVTQAKPNQGSTGTTQTANKPTTGPQTIVNRYAPQAMNPSTPMVPFNPGASGYSAVVLPPPGTSPAGANANTGIAPTAQSMNAAQSLINAIPAQPLSGNSGSSPNPPAISNPPSLGNSAALNNPPSLSNPPTLGNSTASGSPPTSNAPIGGSPVLAYPPNLRNTQPVPGNASQVASVPALTSPAHNGMAASSESRTKVNSRDLPGAGQLLPRNVPASEQLSNSSTANNSMPQLQRLGAGDASAQGASPVLGGLADVPDITRAGNDGSRLISFSNNNPSNQPQPSEQVITDIWNTRLVAIVGNERVLAGDMAAIIEPRIAEISSKITSKKQENEIRQIMVRQLLPQFVEMKALQQEFFRDIAGNVTPKELQKKKDEIMSKASKAFYDKYVTIELYRRYEVEDLSLLEEKLQNENLSLSIMKNHFLMQVLAMQLEDKYVADSFEIPPGDILAYYEKNIDRWRISARAKWRELTVRFDKHPNRTEADNLIKQMGNEVLFTGKPFEAVARDSSEGATASNGGKHDWTNQGSLKSEIIDQAIFSLPLRRLSQVIEDEVGFHIVEVLEREPARIQDMSEIQAEIRKILSDEIRKEKLKEFRKKVMARVPVWSKWPEDIPGSKPLEQTIEDTDR